MKRSNTYHNIPTSKNESSNNFNMNCQEKESVKKNCHISAPIKIIRDDSPSRQKTISKEDSYNNNFGLNSEENASLDEALEKIYLISTVIERERDTSPVRQRPISKKKPFNNNFVNDLEQTKLFKDPGSREYQLKIAVKNDFLKSFKYFIWQGLKLNSKYLNDIIDKYEPKDKYQPNKIKHFIQGQFINEKINEVNRELLGVILEIPDHFSTESDDN